MQPGENIVGLFLSSSSLYPEKIAIVYKKEKINYGHLSEEVIATANYFNQKGIKPGDRILVFIPMSIQLYTTLLAIFYLGAVAVFLDEWVSKERMELCCKIAGCKGFIVPMKIRFLGIFSKEIRKIPVKLSPHKTAHIRNIQLFQPTENSEALITFTTGSTGTPKAANRTHHFLLGQYSALKPLLPLDSNVDMTLLPIVLLLNLGAGKTSVIGDYKANKPENFQPEKIFSELKNNAVTSITFSPYFLVSLAQFILNNDAQLPLIKNILSGGGPVFPDEAEIILQAFPLAEFTIVYGSTEAEPVSHISAKEFLQNFPAVSKGLCVGKGDDAAKIKIIEFDENPLIKICEVKTNEPGEIVVAGEHVLKNYLDNETAFRQNKIQEGNIIWHRTGDAGYLDNAGNLFLLGRCKQIIYWKGRKYFPFLVENMLKNIQGVRCGTLLMKKNEPVIIIEADTDYHAEQLTQKLAEYKLAEFDTIQLHTIPKDKRHYTKIDYEKLKELIH